MTKNNLFLSQDEIADLTGLRQCAAQRRWLDANGWVYQQDVQGRPKVARCYFERKMTEEEAAVSADPIPKSPWSVNTEAIRRA